MTNATADRARRSRRTILVSGALALVGLFVLGAFVEIPAMQHDLVTSVDDALPVDVTVEFRAQDGTLRCAAPLEDPAAMQRIAEGVRGVRTITLDATCLGIPTTTTVAGIVDSISSDSGTLAPPASTTTVTTTTAAVTTTSAPPVTTAEPADVSITFQDGRLSMQGRVASIDQHAALLTAAAGAVSPANITDGLDADPSIAITDGEVASLVAVMKAMVVPLVSAELGWRPDGLFVRGSYTDAAAMAAFEAVAGEAGITSLQLVPRHVATADDAAALEAELNALVAAEPILFDKGETTVSPASAATVERVAGIAKRLGGVIITVQGHTDSEGDAGRNQQLSDQRAEAVRAELVRLGVPPADLVSVGYGETQLVLDPNGREDPARSRRVVFTVTTTG